MPLQDILSLRSQPGYCSSVAFRIFCDEHPCKRNDLICPFPQGREMQMHCIYPVVEVFPKLSASDHLLQVLVCGAYQTDVYGNRLCVTDSGYASVLKHAEEFCL